MVLNVDHYKKVNKMLTNFELAMQLSSLLPDYQAKDVNNDAWYVNLSHKTIPEKGIFVDCKDGHKWRITLSFPRGQHNDIYRPDIVPEINVSKNRGVEALARDIARKLLSGYDEEFAKQLERKQKAESYYNKKMALRNKIVELLEDTIAPHQQDSQEITIYNFGVDWIRAEDDSVTFKVDLPEEVAVEFCSWLKDRMPRKRNE